MTEIICEKQGDVIIRSLEEALVWLKCHPEEITAQSAATIPDAVGRKNHDA